MPANVVAPTQLHHATGHDRELAAGPAGWRLCAGSLSTSPAYAEKVRLQFLSLQRPRYGLADKLKRLTPRQLALVETMVDHLLAQRNLQTPA
jgi:hypothetical protein